MKKLFLYFNFAISFLVFLFSCQSNEKTKTPLQDFIDKTALLDGGFEEDQEARTNWIKDRLSLPDGKMPKSIYALDKLFLYNYKRNMQALRQDTIVDTTYFSLRGPYNVGGRTRAFAIDVTNENIYIAGGVSGGIWRSTNAGASWSRVGDRLSHPGVVSIAQDTRPGYTNIWYSLAGEIYGTSASADGAFYLGDGMMRSLDGGITWEPLASTTAGGAASFSNDWQGGWRVAVNPVNGHVFAAVYGSVYRSIDSGATWVAELGGSAGTAYFTDVAISTNGVVYTYFSYDGSAGARGIYRSPDGDIWTKIKPNTGFATQHDRYVIGIDHNNEDIVYFLGVNIDSVGHLSTSYQGDPEYHSFWKYQYLSGDGDSSGGIWTDLSNNLPSSATTQFDKFYAQGGYDICVSVQPGNSNNIVIGGTNTFISTSGFMDDTHTLQIGGYGIGTRLPFFTLYPNHHPDQHGFVFLPSDPKVLINYNDGGIYRTSDCLADNVVWDKLDNGYITSQFYTIALDQHHNNNILFGGLQDNGTFWTTSDNYSDNWVMPFNGDGSYCYVSSDKTYYMSRQQGRLVKCKLNEYGTITQLARIDPIAGIAEDEYLWMNPFVVDPFDENTIFWIAKHKLWRNNSINTIPMVTDPIWDSISTGWEVVGDTLNVSNLIFTQMEMSKDPNHKHRLYIGTNKRRIFRMDNSNEAIPTMTEITGLSATTDGEIFPAAGYITDIAVDPLNADNVMVAFSNYGVYSIYYSIDAGDHWMKASGNLESDVSGQGAAPSVRCVLIAYDGSSIKYYAGTSVGLFSTRLLNGISTIWIQESPQQIGEAVVETMDFRLSDGTLVVATHGNGVFQSKINPSYANISYHSTFTIYPVPADNYFIVSNEENEKYDLDIFDIKGRWIASYRNEVQYRIPTNHLTSGHYFVKLSSNTTSFIQKIVIVH